MTMGRPRQSDAQRERIRALLERHRGQWVELPAILRLGIAQYNARIRELRREGCAIENRCEYREGEKHSWFRIP
jgi:hypothetical protein